MLQSYYSTLTTHTHTQLVYNGANGYIKNNKRTTKKKDDERKREKKLRRKRREMMRVRYQVQVFNTGST